MKNTVILLLWVFSFSASANPYPDPTKVPKDTVAYRGFAEPMPMRRSGRAVLRVDLQWVEDRDEFTLAGLVRENSGTSALVARSKSFDGLGSYVGRLVDSVTGQSLGVDALGTGSNFRKLSRSLSFRFPYPQSEVSFQLVAEDPITGNLVTTLKTALNLSTVTVPVQVPVDSRLLRAAKTNPALQVVVYAEGYRDGDQGRFFREAQKVVSGLEESNFPEVDRMEFVAVFSKSAQTLGAASDLGLPVQERDSFLGLYYPYWFPFGRWYHVVYPTRGTKYRNRIGQVPYDYPIALVDSSRYWGVGNFMELTAVPSRNSSFTYLLLHEFGHYFGLNEEYEGGGATELAFAPGVGEPWSQNITFNTNPLSLKWRDFVTPGTPIPTPRSKWNGSGPWGAYRGGYAETAPKGHSHKPGWSCTMSSGKKFCPICVGALRTRVRRDAGL